MTVKKKKTKNKLIKVPVTVGGKKTTKDAYEKDTFNGWGVFLESPDGRVKVQALDPASAKDRDGLFHLLNNLYGKEKITLIRVIDGMPHI